MRLALVVVLLAACGKKPSCPWDWVPGTTTAACSADSLTKTSTAAEADLATAFRAHGYKLGRDETWMPTDKRMIAVGADGKTFLIDYAGDAITLQPSTAPRSLIMEPELATVLATGTDQRAYLETLRDAGTWLAAPGVPATCTGLTAPSGALINLSLLQHALADEGVTPQFGVPLYPLGMPAVGDLKYLASRRVALDEGLASDLVTVVRVDGYDEPETRGSYFVSGAVAITLGIVDRRAKVARCVRHFLVHSSDSVEITMLVDIKTKLRVDDWHNDNTPVGLDLRNRTDKGIRRVMREMRGDPR